MGCVVRESCYCLAAQPREAAIFEGEPQPYRELGADFLDRRNAENVKRYLVKRLERLGLQVTVQSSADTAALPA